MLKRYTEVIKTNKILLNQMIFTKILFKMIRTMSGNPTKWQSNKYEYEFEQFVNFFIDIDEPIRLEE